MSNEIAAFRGGFFVGVTSLSLCVGGLDRKVLAACHVGEREAEEIGVDGCLWSRSVDSTGALAISIALVFLVGAGVCICF
jgi:hypothetical protein